MRRATGPTFSPDATKATDATVDLGTRAEAARGLVRDEGVRTAAADALVKGAASADDRDTGSQLPGDVADETRNAVRVARRTLGTERRGNSPSGESPSEAADQEPPARQAATDATHDDALPKSHAQSTRRSAEPARNEHHHARTGDSTGTPMRSGRAGTWKGPGDGSHKQSTGRIVRQQARDAKTTAHGHPTRVLARTHTSQPMALVARHARHGVATRRTVASGARAAIASGTATGASAGGGAIAAGSGGAGIAAAPIAAVILVLLLVVVLFGALLGGGAVEEDQTRGAHRLAQTATNEYLAGKSRGDYNHKGLVYSTFVRGTLGGKDNWDVCLVGWCMARAGFIDAGLTHAYDDAGSYIAHFRYNPELGEIHDWNAGAYAPVEGDIFVVPRSDGTQHIGIVTSCDGTRFETVEGDVAGGPNGTYDRDEEDGHGGYVACRTRRLRQYSYTFIHPYYSEEAVTGK